ncbi:MAG: hypothetical protein D6B27_00995, partial [Gammaproteobacteria bacterium]
MKFSGYIKSGTIAAALLALSACGGGNSSSEGQQEGQPEGQVEDTPPVIESVAVSPETDVTAGDQVVITVIATDDNGITTVELYNNEALVGSLNAGDNDSYSYTLTAEEGNYNFIVKAVDTEEQVTESSSVALAVDSDVEEGIQEEGIQEEGIQEEGIQEE